MRFKEKRGSIISLMISNICVLTIFLHIFVCVFFFLFMSFYCRFVYFLNCCKTYWKLHPVCLFTVQSENRVKYSIYKEKVEHTNADTDWCPTPESRFPAPSYFLVVSPRPPDSFRSQLADNGWPELSKCVRIKIPEIPIYLLGESWGGGGCVWLI